MTYRYTSVKLTDGRATTSPDKSGVSDTPGKSEVSDTPDLSETQNCTNEPKDL